MSKLVMIDDNSLEHLIVQRMLDKNHWFNGAQHFDDGRKVIELLRENRLEPKKLPDVILLDIQMPNYNGWDFLEEFREFARQLLKCPDIYVLSSSVDAMDIAKAEKSPFVKGFFSKPLAKDQLVMLHHVYEGSKAG